MFKVFSDIIFEESIEGDSFFSSKIEELDNIRSFTKTKMGFKYSEGSIIYNVRGTRYYLMVKKDFWPPGIGDYTSVRLTWFYKKKNKKDYQKISLEEILDSPLISNVAKSEIVFNLNVFLTAS